MATYQQLIDQRRRALQKNPPNFDLARKLLIRAEKLAASDAVTDDEIKAAHF